MSPPPETVPEIAQFSGYSPHFPSIPDSLHDIAHLSGASLVRVAMPHCGVVHGGAWMQTTAITRLSRRLASPRSRAPPSRSSTDIGMRSLAKSWLGDASDGMWTPSSPGCAREHWRGPRDPDVDAIGVAARRRRRRRRRRESPIGWRRPDSRWRAIARTTRATGH